ncbi:MAG: hypothetical protein K2X81_08770 [Candidatus Obscuribacterales bacterium]|nr:hypothetical protein [Candidatus Obscuribacterales bacterium]
MTGNVERDAPVARFENRMTIDAHSALSSEAWPNDVSTAARKVLNEDLGPIDHTYRGLDNSPKDRPVDDISWQIRHELPMSYRSLDPFKDYSTDDMVSHIKQMLPGSYEAVSSPGPSEDVTRAAANILNHNLGSAEDTYKGLHKLWTDDLTGNLLPGIGRQIGKSAMDASSNGSSEQVAKAAINILNESLGSVRDTYRGNRKR